MTSVATEREREECEKQQLLDNLTVTQDRCSDLLEHSRDLRQLVRDLAGFVDDYVGGPIPARFHEAIRRAAAIARGAGGDRCGQCGRLLEDLGALSAKCGNFYLHLEAVKERTSVARASLLSSGTIQDLVAHESATCICKVEEGERFAHPACLSVHQLSAVGIVFPDGRTRRGSWLPTTTTIDPPTRIA